MRPDVEGLIGHLEEAEDAGSGGTLWVSVAKEDALLMEHLWRETGKGKEVRQQEGCPGWLISSVCWSSPFLPLSTLLPGAPKILQAVPSQLRSEGQASPGRAIWLCTPGCAYPGHECCLRVRVCTLPEAYGLVFRCLRGWLACMLSARGSLPWMSEAGRAISAEDPPSEMMYSQGAS